MSMERAGRILGKLKLPKAVIDPEAMARSAWPAAVGKRIAAKTRGREVGSSGARRGMRGRGVAAAVEYTAFSDYSQIAGLSGRNVGYEYRFPAHDSEAWHAGRRDRASSGFGVSAHSQTGTKDEADLIQDPVFRMLYKQSRRKSTGLDSPVQEPLFAYEPEETKKKASA